MCRKNDYGRKAVTVILALLTALFVLALMSGKADAAARRENTSRTNGINKFSIDTGAPRIVFGVLAKRTVNSYNIPKRL